MDNNTALILIVLILSLLIGFIAWLTKDCN